MTGRMRRWWVPASVVMMLGVMLPMTSSWAVPSAPTGVTATRGEGSIVTVNWAVSTGATQYTVRAYKSESGNETWDVCGAANGSDTTCSGGDTLNVPRTSETWIAVVAEDGVGGTSSSTPRVKVVAYPSAPTISTVTAASGSLIVTWAAGSSTSPIPAATSFTATAYTTALGTTSAGTACTVAGTTCTITGLANGTTYYVAVVGSASGGADKSDESVRVSGTPVGSPSPPTSVTVQGGDGIVSVSWGTPTDAGGSTIASYQAAAYAGPSGGAAVSTCQPSPVTGTSCVLEGLTNGTMYYVAVTATNGAGGTGTSERITSQPGGRPTAPLSVSAVRADGAVDVAWEAPASDGGSAITGYTARVFTSSSSSATAVGTCTTASTNCTIGGLVNATTYYVNVIATSAVGDSVPSSRVTVSPSSKPTQPRSVQVERGNGFARVSWQAPLNSGGNRITKYIVRAYATATSTEVLVDCSPLDSQLRCNLGPLPNGTTYYVDVVALGPLFTSDPTTPRVAVLPATQPSAPRDVVATQVGTGVEVRWKVPAADGGQPITRYTATAYGDAATGTASVGTCTTSGATCTIASISGPPVYVSVTATNSVGTSTSSSPRVKVTLIGAPSQPRDVTVERRQKSVDIGWLPSLRPGDSPITHYRAVVTGTDGRPLGSCLRGAPKRADAVMECRVFGIRAGASVVVTAYNARRETSADSVAIPGVQAVLLAPTALEVFGSDGSLVATADRASDHSGKVTYEFRAWSKASGGIVVGSCSTEASQEPSCVIDGLPNYEPAWVDVRSVSGKAVSKPTARLERTPMASPPSAPRDVRVTSQSGELVVTWRPPLSDGGYAIRQTTVSVFAKPLSTGQTDATPIATCTALRSAQRCVIRGVVQEYVYVQAVSINGPGRGTPSVVVERLTAAP